MNTKIDVWNMALARVGAQSVVSDTDENLEASLCRFFWAQTVDEILRLNHWNCALKRAELARLSEPPAFEWSYAYRLPVDFISLAQLEVSSADYVIEGNLLLCNLEVCRIKYVRRMNNPAEFSPWMTACVVLNLAAKLAPKLTNNENASSPFTNELYQIALPQGRVADAYDSSNTNKRDSWLDFDKPPLFGDENIQVFGRF
ncbi:MAG: hypothetical protein JXR78_16750 [Victivallales bacterium]|nr:hypothetical protein [Victivallales bacterium]